MESFEFNPFGKQRGKKKRSESSSPLLKEESPLDVLLISGHGGLVDDIYDVPSNSVYIYDAHCGSSSVGTKVEKMFFKKRIPDDSTYLSSWILNTTNNKLGGTDVLVKRPSEKYYDSSLSLILDFRRIDGNQEHELIDECDKIDVQKSGIYSYNAIKHLENEYDATERVLLDYVYINDKGKMKRLDYDYDAKSYKSARKKLLRRHPNAEPFYIITKEDVRDIYENSIFPTVEDLEMLFDEGEDFMRYTDFRESISMCDIKVSECFDSYKNSIIIIPSCRENDEITKTRIREMQNDSLENVEDRFVLDSGVNYFSSSPKSSNKKTRKASHTKNKKSSKRSGGKRSGG
jgi:hypothetical protein